MKQLTEIKLGPCADDTRHYGATFKDLPLAKVLSDKQTSTACSFRAVAEFVLCYQCMVLHG